jgi:Mn2+/Fe2+ NRAMP family transporter
MPASRRSLLARFGPGILVAATGIGAGDLITASLAGSEVGLVVIWACVLGALLKWSINEGIARWQFATGTTLIEGWTERLGPWFSWIFLGYFLIWSFAVGGALASACGIAADGFLRIGDQQTSRIIWGILHSAVGGLLVWRGGFKRFEQIMTACTVIMVLSVLISAVLIVVAMPGDSLATIIPSELPHGREQWIWVLGVIGGIGGTVTMLSYGYWIREAGWRGEEGLRTSRLDLIVSYTLAAFFGSAMVVIGSRITGTGKGAAVALQLGDQLATALGPFAKWVFLAGFWAAVTTSLLGVWQGAPYLFADFLRARRLRGHRRDAREEHVRELRRSKPYRWFLLAIATLPLVLLWGSVKEVQLIYATLGAAFMPATALTLLVMNNRGAWVGKFRNRMIANILLGLTLAVFTYLAIAGIRE